MEKSILEMGFSDVDKHMEQWHQKREAKGKVYQAIKEYILFLVKSLEYEEDSYQRYLIEKEIKKLRKKQQEYYVPSILEMEIYPTCNEAANEKKNIFSGLIKKIKR